MGTPDFAVPTLVELVARGYDIAAVYTRAPKPAGRRGMELTPTPVEREARNAGLAVLTPTTLRTAEAQAEFRAHRADAAVVVAYGLILPKPILDAPPLGCFNLHASLLAALARRRADRPRHHGRRHRDRGDGDEDGGGARHRPDRARRARRHRPRHDRGRIARCAGAARRRPDGARTRRAGARRPDADAAAGRRASPTPPRSTRARRASIGRSRGRRCTTIAAGCRRFPARGANGRTARACACCERRAAMAAARPARCSTVALTVACGEGALRIVELQRAGKQAMKAEEFLRGTPLAPGASFDERAASRCGLTPPGKFPTDDAALRYARRDRLP